MSEPRDAAQVIEQPSSPQEMGVEVGLTTVEDENQRLAAESTQVIDGQKQVSTRLESGWRHLRRCP
jgi:hypothetical protein